MARSRAELSAAEPRDRKSSDDVARRSWPPPPTMAAGLATLALVFVLWGTSIPLGVPGEWTWDRIETGEDDRVDALVGLGIGTFAAVGVGAAILLVGARRMETAGRRETGAWFAALVVAGFWWLKVAQEIPPHRYGIARSPFVLHDPGASGYHTLARDDFGDVRTFLAGYAERMRRGDVLHIGTHPPGLVLLHRAALVACRESGLLREAVLWSEPDAVRTAVEYLPGSVPPAEEAALWLAALVVRSAAAATVVPLFLLLRLTGVGRRTAWTVSAAWLFAPGVVVFLPKSDVLYPGLGAGVLWLWETGRRRSCPGFSTAAGVLLWCGLLLSLAFVPVAAAAVLWGLLSVARPADGSTRKVEGVRLAKALAWGAVGVLVPTGVLRAAAGCNLFAVWTTNLGNHAAFYAHYPRTYWKWLLVGPFDFALSAGPAVCVVAAWGTVGILRAGLSPRSEARRGRVVDPVAFGAVGACAGIGLLLWLSGRNLGETARLWLMFAPWAAWSAGIALAASGRESTGAQTPRSDAERAANGEAEADKPAALLDTAGIVLIAQVVACLAVAARVSGFRFGGI